jgi:hypothetical protein
MDAYRVFAELAHEHFCRPRPTAVSGTLDALRHAFVDHSLEVNLHAANEAIDGAAFARLTLDMPPGPDAKARKAVADKRKAVTNFGSNSRPRPTYHQT